MCRGYNVMKSYYQLPEATAQAVDPDGWLHSGNLGTMDGNGYFKITGRIKDLIIRGGETISPREIEEFLLLVDTYPMTASGKIQKFKLRELGVTWFKERGVEPV